MSLIETKKKNEKNDKFLKKIKMTILKNEKKKKKRKKWETDSLIKEIDLWYIHCWFIAGPLVYSRSGFATSSNHDSTNIAVTTGNDVKSITIDYNMFMFNPFLANIPIFYYLKTPGNLCVLVFPGGIKCEHWPEMG